jgi:cytochrome c biogenesis protein
MDPSVYYKETYGTLGEIYYTLGLSHTYNSWWFITLLFMIGTSLVVCSLDRVLPLYRALSKQSIRKHLDFITRQKVAYQGLLPAQTGESATALTAAPLQGGESPAIALTAAPLQGGESPVIAQAAAPPSAVNRTAQSEDAAKEWVRRMAVQLQKQHYRVHTEGTALLAEKNRFSRWGPYINHIGLIIFLLAVLARSIPGWHMDQYIGFLEGKPVKIPGTVYYLENEKFTVEFYNEQEMSPDFRKKGQAVPKKYETQAVLYVCASQCGPGQEPVLKEVHRQNIEVNKPLQYKGLLAYQFNYRQTPMILSVKPEVKNPQTGESYGKLDLSTFNPAPAYDVGPYHFDLKNYFPDFALDEQGKPKTETNDPKKPAYIFSVKGPGLSPQGEIYLYFPRQIDRQSFRQDELNGAIARKLTIASASMDDVKIANNTSYLNIRKDTAMPYIWVGTAISMIGLILGFYWQHRRIWLRVDDGQIALGAHTNKNWFGLRKEAAAALRKNGIDVEAKSLERRM